MGSEYAAHSWEIIVSVGLRLAATAIISRSLLKHTKYEDDDDDDDVGDDSEIDDVDDIDDDNYDSLHQRLDSSRLPPSEFQMGTEQGGGAVDTRCLTIIIIIADIIIIITMMLAWSLIIITVIPGFYHHLYRHRRQ